MKLISCDNCAVVLDKDKMYFPSVWNKNGDGIDQDKAICDKNGKYISILPCPVCGEIIRWDEGDDE